MFRIFLFVITLLYSVSGESLFADVVILKNGITINNIKVKVRKEFAEFFFENGKKEIKKKNELKSIRLRPVTWTINSEDKESKKNEESVVNPRQKIVYEFAKLEQQREQNFAISPRIIEERKRNDFLMKERIRLQFTEGFLDYAGGQTIYTEIMVKLKDRLFVKNEYGLLYFTYNDFGDNLIIETDSGKEKIPLTKIQAVKEEKYINGYIYLASGEKYKGKIIKVEGGQTFIATAKGNLNIAKSEILFPVLIENIILANKIAVKEGESGLFIFSNGDSVKGKLLKLSQNSISIETAYGIIEINPSNLISASKEDLLE